jgi:hypothetical protein
LSRSGQFLQADQLEVRALAVAVTWSVISVMYDEQPVREPRSERLGGRRPGLAGPAGADGLAGNSGLLAGYRLARRIGES